MITRRAVVLGLLLAIAPFARTWAAEQTAKDFVTAIYAKYKGKDAKGVSIARTADLQRYFTPSLVTLITKDRSAAAKRGDVPTLDGDPFVNAQDWEIESFDVAVRDTSANKAAATVSFTNAGTAATAVLDLVKLKQGWRVDDITYDGKDTLRGLFKPSKAR